MIENEIVQSLLSKVFEGGGFLWGFISGGVVILIFRETIVKFIVIKLLKWKNGKKSEEKNS